MRYKYQIVFILLIGKSLVSFGQNNNSNGIIPSLFYRGRITNRFDYNLFASATFLTKTTLNGNEYPARNSEVYLQPSLVYKYSKEINFAIGYTYIRGDNFLASKETEQQIWQQFILEQAIFKGFMLHRFRLVENIKNNFSPSLNYQIAFEKPLQGRVLDNGEFYFTCFNESFLDLSSGQSRVFQANWSFAGIGYKTSKAGKFEFGPLAQIALHNETGGRNALFLLQILWIGDSHLFSSKW